TPIGSGHTRSRKPTESQFCVNQCRIFGHATTSAISAAAPEGTLTSESPVTRTKLAFTNGTTCFRKDFNQENFTHTKSPSLISSYSLGFAIRSSRRSGGLSWCAGPGLFENPCGPTNSFGILQSHMAAIPLFQTSAA